MNFEPKTKRLIIICITVFLITIIGFFTFGVMSGHLSGDDVVNILDAFGGLFEKEALKK